MSLAPKRSPDNRYVENKINFDTVVVHSDRVVNSCTLGSSFVSSSDSPSFSPSLSASISPSLSPSSSVPSSSPDDNFAFFLPALFLLLVEDLRRPITNYL